MTKRRRAGVLTGVLAVAVALTACGGAQSRFAIHMKRGEGYFSHGDYVKASIEFRNALQIEPRDARALLMAGRSADRLGNERQAAGLLQAAIDSSPDNLAARKDLARIMVLAGAAEMAMKTLEPALAAQPEDPVLLNLRGSARVELGDQAGAVADIDHALRLEPTNSDAILARAGLYKRAGDTTRAIAQVSAALAKSPQAPVLREVLADLYAGSGEPAKAEEQLRTLVTLTPQEPRYRYELANFYVQSQRLDDAQRVLNDAVTAMPRRDDVKLALVEFLGTHGVRGQSEQLLRRFIAKDPDNLDLRLGLGALLQRSQAWREATDVYRDVIRRDGTESRGLVARDRLAAMAWAQSRGADAAGLIAEVLDKNPQDSYALTLRAQIELAHSDARAAIADLRAVLRDHPETAGLHRLLARAYVSDGQLALAEESLRAVMELAPDDTRARAQLAQLLLQTQRIDQAVALLEETVRRFPTDAQVRGELAHAYLTQRDFAAARKTAVDFQRLQPDWAAGPYILGMADVGLNELDSAQREFEQALAKQPRSFEPLSALVRLEQARGRLTDAMSLVKKAVDEDSTSAAKVNLLGELYIAQKNPALAARAFETATRLSPTWWIAYRNWGRALAQARDTTGAVAAYRAGIKAAPLEPQLVIELATFYEQQRGVDEAIGLCDRWYRENPHEPSVASTLAWLLVTYRSDRASLDRARELSAQFASSSDARLLDTNGWVHFKRAEYAQALPVLQRALAQAPDSREILYHVGMAELRSGQAERGRHDLEAALSGAARFFGDDQARSTLAALKQHTG